ncbi:MAG: hypothetical protein AAFN43_01465 [Pseudomonadota bacterium]
MTKAIDPSLLSINSSWPGLIADLSLEHGSFVIDASTSAMPPAVDGNGDWVQIEGASSSGCFILYLPASLCISILEAADASIDIEALDGETAAIVLEHVASQRLSQLEEVLGHDLAFKSLSDVNAEVTGRLLGLELRLQSEVHQAALKVSGKLLEDLEQTVNANANFEEKELPSTLSVQLGPVVVSTRNAYLARKGEIIDCGVMPSDVIHGILMRKDKRYWPIYIEDHSVEIAGPLAGPVDFSSVDDGQVYVTFGIGEADLTPLERSKAGVGTRIAVQRFPDNEARVYYQSRPFAKGALSLHGENLAVTLHAVGAFSE